MKKGPMIVAFTLLVVAGVTLTPGSALAQRSRGSMAGGGARVGVNGAGRGFVAQQNFAQRPGFRPGFNHPGFGHHHRFPFRPFFPFGVVAAAPAVVYAAPYYYPYPPAYYPPPYYDPPVYSAPATYSPPVSYAPPPSSTVSVAPAPPSAPPSPNVVEFATGRYELRGDGVSTPYTWVWIPNPPTSPPPAAPPAGEPGTNGSSGASGRAPARAGQLYRWTDAQGVVYWTDRLDAVPEQYRSKAKSSPAS